MGYHLGGLFANGGLGEENHYQKSSHRCGGHFELAVQRLFVRSKTALAHEGVFRNEEARLI